MAGNFDSTIREVMNSTKSKPTRNPPPDSPAELAQDKARGIKPNSPQDRRLDAEAGDSPAEIARDRAQGIKQGSPQDIQMDARGMPPDAHHIAAATSIAHAILNRRPVG